MKFAHYDFVMKRSGRKLRGIVVAVVKDGDSARFAATKKSRNISDACKLMNVSLVEARFVYGYVNGKRTKMYIAVTKGICVPAL